MKRLLFAAAALLCAACFAVPVQSQMTPVTATGLKTGGVLIPAGTVTMTPVNGVGSPTPLSIVTSNGTLNSPQGYSAPIVNGAIAAGYAVPDQVLSSATVANTSIAYMVQVVRTTAPSSSFTFVIPASTPVVTGSAPFALDNYRPTQTVTALAAGMSSGATVPARCTVPGTFQKTSVLPYGKYTCQNGVFVLDAAAGGAALPAGTGLVKTTGGNGSVAVADVDFATPGAVNTAVNTEATRAQAAEAAASSAANTAASTAAAATAAANAASASASAAAATANAACPKTGCAMTGPQKYVTGANLYQDFTDVAVYPSDPLTGNTNRWLSPIGVTPQITLVPKTASPLNKTSVMLGNTVTLPNGLGSATQLSYGPTPAVMTWSPTGVSSMQYTQPESALWPLSHDIRINSWSVMLPTTAAGCTTAPVLAIQQGGTVLATITVTNGTPFLASQTLPIVVSSFSDSLGIYVSTAGVGCTTYPSQVYSTVEYQSQ